MIDLKQGDCLELMKDIPDKSVDMILCDLPYGSTRCKWDSVIPFEPLWEQYNRILKFNGVVVLFAAQPFTTKLINSNIRDFRYCWYWLKNNKTGFVYACYQPMRQIEDICVFYKRGGRYSTQGLKPYTRKQNLRKITTDIYAKRGKPKPQKYTGYPTHILKFNGVNSNSRQHPTQKPVELLEYLIKTYTNEGDTVLDNCMGSGSTGVACVNMGRNFIGIELDGGYFEIAKSRISEAETIHNQQKII